jgi:hypothetical protein
MVIFPLALAIAEIVPTVGWRPAWRPRRVLPLLGAVGSLLAWIAFFGGMGPASGLREWPRHMSSILHLTPAWGLYSLTCIGAYFVIPELVLFRRREALSALRTRRSLGLALAIASCVLLFPPLAQGATMGALNRVLLLVLPPELLGDLSATIRNLVFGVLAWLACVRFARVDLIFWLLLLNVLLMSTTFQAWEKYNLPMLVTLWFLRSIHDLDHPLEVWQATRHPAQGEPHLGVG